MENLRQPRQAWRKTTTLYKVDAEHCNLRIGDLVDEETIVGNDVRSGKAMKAGLNGRVQSMIFNKKDHALIIAVCGAAA
jgi:hypothetical protein